MKFVMQITGRTPLLMHQDNLEWQDKLKEWLADPDNKKRSVPGDDRHPGFTWIGSIYEANGKAVLTQDMLLKCLVNAGAKVIKQRTTTYKAVVASAVYMDAVDFPLTVGGDEVPIGELIAKLADEFDYQKHCKAVEKCGFTLYAKRAPIGGAKHVRVRPRFDQWECVVTGEVEESELSRDMFTRIAAIAGARVGLGDWRPSAPKSPGSYGMFSAELKFSK